MCIRDRTSTSTRRLLLHPPSSSPRRPSPRILLARAPPRSPWGRPFRLFPPRVVPVRPHRRPRTSRTASRVESPSSRRHRRRLVVSTSRACSRECRVVVDRATTSLGRVSCVRGCFFIFCEVRTRGTPLHGYRGNECRECVYRVRESCCFVHGESVLLNTTRGTNKKRRRRAVGRAVGARPCAVSCVMSHES